MKKRLLIIILIIIPFIISLIFIMFYQSNRYTIQKAIANEDFITYPEQRNIDRFDQFLEDINHNINTELRITEFSKEGRPKINDIKYSNHTITLHSFYPNHLFDKEHHTQVFTDYLFEDNGDFFFINDNGSRAYVCQIKGR